MSFANRGPQAPFLLLPAIDLKEGKAVRLKQGRMEDATVYYPDPTDAASRWLEGGAQALHVVDLDGAIAGQPQNLAAIGAICAVCAQRSVPVQLGGGLRSLAAIAAALAAGVSRVIIGSKALGSDLVEQALARFGPDAVICGIDARNGLVATDGWVNVSTTTAVELAGRLQKLGVCEVVYTDISRDGMLGGPNFDATARLAADSGLGVIASGGVSSLDDVRRLLTIPGVSGAILGKALYEGTLSLPEALALGGH